MYIRSGEIASACITGSSSALTCLGWLTELNGSYWPIGAVTVSHCLDCYDEAPSARCLSFR